ncbi:PadR family transcriptional regulator [Thermopolyspora flexuosa]|uniref:DNA-binding PadR family transcriptional regulator n=1 Tax=Thermopolyspora flexuosa TaxID=103836 RepID=A0A543IVP2_9ACTN|nr:PadR family transcriptional regulator [Thermopolyspora flexuosa]TQM74646.1 DNA-binding PadR family transcriptional regulator [Thermopolyspora flexuosa]GGM77771.1 PadR family transcriptional regulator [Thermopolyspora flexuosa]
MSSTRVLILGVLLDGPLHGYEVRRRLELWGADQWAHVAFGSIYHGLAKMAEEGLLRRLGEGTGGRTRYEITEAGRAEFMRLLMRHWWEIRPIVDPFQVALTFMDRLSPADLVAAMEGRAAQLRAAIEMTQRAMAAKRAHGAPRHIDETLRLNAAQLKAQLEWIEDALRRVEKGELP